MALQSIIRWFGGRLIDATSGNAPAFNRQDFEPAVSTRLLILQPTPFCNINCDYCYLPDRALAVRMDIATLRTAACRLRDDNLLPPELTVVWHAGEPLAMPRIWYEEAFDVLDEVLGSLCRVTHSIQTNATLIDDSWCRLFLRYQVRIGVSIDGTADLHDAHRRTRHGKGTHASVMQGMAVLRSHGISFHAIAVVTPATFAAVEEFADFFEANPVSELGCNVEEIEGGHSESSLNGHEASHGEFLERLLERSRRPGSQLRVRELGNALNLIARPLPTVAWRGRRWPFNSQVLPFQMVNVAHDGRWCTFSPELLGQRGSSPDQFVFGNVHDAGYLQGAQSGAFRRAWDEIIRGTDMCEQECAHFPYCGGGAPVNKFYENSSLASSETMYCRSVLKRPFNVVLAQLERDRQNVLAAA
jgi:uncharacterized protein